MNEEHAFGLGEGDVPAGYRPDADDFEFCAGMFTRGCGAISAEVPALIAALSTAGASFANLGAAAERAVTAGLAAFLPADSERQPPVWSAGQRAAEVAAMAPGYREHLERPPNTAALDTNLFERYREEMRALFSHGRANYGRSVNEAERTPDGGCGDGNSERRTADNALFLGRQHDAAAVTSGSALRAAAYPPGGHRESRRELHRRGFLDCRSTHRTGGVAGASAGE